MSPHSWDAIVIGAGLAGLSAAVRLAAAGCKVLVLEAGPQLGGRATSFRDRLTGDRVDNGQHVLFGCYRETADFLELSGGSNGLRRAKRLELPVIDESGRMSELACPRLPPPWHLAAGLLRWRAIGPGERLAALRLGSVITAGPEPSDRQPPNETVSQWLERHRQPPDVRRLLWEPLALAALNEPLEVAGARAFLTVLERLFTASAAASAIWLPVGSLDEVLARPARAFVERSGGIVRTGTLARVEAGPHGVMHVRAGGEHFAGKVIAAVPWWALPTLFGVRPPALIPLCDGMARTPARAIVSAHLWTDGPLLERDFYGLPGRTFQWVFDPRRLSKQAAHVSLIASAADHLVRLPDAELVALATNEIGKALPGVVSTPVRHVLVVRQPRATFSVAPGLPERPGPRSPIDGLYLAGDWTATGLPATLEGAVLSGRLAAEALLEDERGPRAVARGLATASGARLPVSVS